MKKLVLASVCLLAVSAHAEKKVIYGSDNRVEARKHSNAKLRSLAKSVAGRVSSYNLAQNGDVFESVTSYTLADSMRVCATERFADQKTLPDCTGFLVGEDILVTAGHCMTAGDCENNMWVFGFEDTSTSFSKSQVYKCKEVIDQAADYSLLGFADDFAVIRLDRKVEGRTPLKFRTSGKIKRGQEIAVIGHPSGLPLKIADDASVKSTFGATFKADLDTYGGNSGSPVFNAKTYEVEGILIQGKQDYVADATGTCAVSAKSSGKGERVFKINKVKTLMKMKEDGAL